MDNDFPFDPHVINMRAIPVNEDDPYKWVSYKITYRVPLNELEDFLKRMGYPDNMELRIVPED